MQKIKICLLTLEQMLLICCYHMALQKIKKKAKIILDSLSFDNHTIKTIYNNKENVHTSTINKTARNTITIIIEDVNKMFQREDIWILTENILQNLIEKYPPNLNR